jgi:hypothetical protein
MTRMILALAAVAAMAQPLRVNPKNHHYFEYHGKPLVIVSSGEHYGAVLNLDFDWRKYLETLSKDGMNYTRLFTGSYVEPPGAFGITRNTLAPAPERFLAPWARSGTAGYKYGGNKFDLTQWSPEYLERLKAYVGEAAQRGIIVEVTLFSSTYNEKMWQASAFHPENNINGTEAIDWKNLCTEANGSILPWQEKLVRKLVRELNGFDNVIFEVQNEPWSDQTVVADVVHPYIKEPDTKKWPNSVDVSSEASLRWQTRVAGWITDEEARLPQRHLIAWNICNYGYPVKTVLPGANILNFHYAKPEAALWNYGLDQPIAYDESGFIGTTDATYRKEAWRFLLAGGGSFNNLDYSFSVGKEDGSDVQAQSPGGGSPALRRQLKILAEFLGGLPLLEMRPDRNVVKRCAGCKTQALSAKGKAYAIHVTGESPAELWLELPAGTYTAEWLDTKTGAVVKQDPVREGKLTSPAFEDDIALRILKSGKK